jgi:YesN/AraC family two-component response regulator
MLIVQNMFPATPPTNGNYGNDTEMGMKNYRVLLIDDQERIRHGIKKILEEMIGDFKVTYEASNGEEAYEIILKHEFDLIITDVRMPRMNGLEFITKLRNINNDTRVIVLSGYDEYSYMRQALKNNVTDYLLKPISTKEFIGIIDSVRNSIEANKASSGNPESLSLDSESEHFIIKKVRKIVEDNYSDDISLQYVCNELSYSYNYISKLFKAKEGKNFTDYLNEVRINKAKSLLANTNLKTYEIAEICGYKNSKYFLYIFKKTINLTTSEYREKYNSSGTPIDLCN